MASSGSLTRNSHNYSSFRTSPADPLIEFFNPNHRKVLEEQDTEIRKRTGQRAPLPAEMSGSI